MQLITKPDFDACKPYWDAFWQKEVIDRPAVCVTAPKRGVEYKPFALTPSASYFCCTEDGWDGTLAKINAQIDSTWYGGEALPQVDLTLGPDEYAAFLGVRLDARRDNPTTWSKPIWDTLEGKTAVLDRSENGAFETLRRCWRELTEKGEGRFFVNVLDFHSHFDALCALREPMEVCLDIMDDPDSVSRALDSIAATYPEIYEAFYEDGRMGERGCIGWPPVYLEKGRFATVCCDFSCLLSPQQGKRFFLPYVEQEIAYLDRNVYHLDGKEALTHLDSLLAMDIDCVQWVPGDGQPRSIYWMELLKKIQAAGKSLWIYDWTPEEIRTRFRELDPARVVFSVHCASQDEGEQLLRDVRL